MSAVEKLQIMVGSALGAAIALGIGTPKFWQSVLVELIIVHRSRRAKIAWALAIVNAAYVVYWGASAILAETDFVAVRRVILSASHTVFAYLSLRIRKLV